MQAKARDIQGQYSGFKENKDASLSEIKDFVKKMPGLKESFKSLQHHINIAEEIKKTTDSFKFRDMWQLERSMIEGDTQYEELEDRY